MHGHNILIFTLFLIFTGAAVLSTAVLFTRQSLLVAYMILGILFGPWGLQVISKPHLVKEIGEIGILFLLFLLGLHLDPHDLWERMKKIVWIGLISSAVFFIVGFIVSYIFKFNPLESCVIAAAMMFSSTMIGLKLLPHNELQKPVGHILIGILLFQDLLAIFVMIFIHANETVRPLWQDIAYALIFFPSLLLIAFVVEKYILRYLFRRFEHVQEYLFLVAIAWCLCMSQLAGQLGLPVEIGAFIAGIAIAEGPAASYIADSLTSLRDFFLVLFFFTIGASFNLQFFSQVIFPAIILSAIMLILKPVLFKWLLQKTGESKANSKEVGIRLGQGSEFSLLLVTMATTSLATEVSDRANYLIEAVTILTFIVSCYWTVFKYPTPMARTKTKME